MLSYREQQVLEMRDRMSDEEIAAHFDVPVGRITQVAQQALKALEARR